MKECVGLVNCLLEKQEDEMWEFYYKLKA
jgi:GntR family transcriptional regulator, transcriptional repressor for pyruvate dehydrogenase complex